MKLQRGISNGMLTNLQNQKSTGDLVYHDIYELIYKIEMSVI